MSPRTLYRTLAFAEAVTWTLLITAMLMKYVGGMGGLPVLIAGSIHGFVFLSYAATAVLVGVNQRWSVPLIALAVLTAFVPYATVPFDLWADRSGRLDGSWRRTATDDPRDAGWVSRLLRWFLAHPRTLGALLVGGIVVVMGALLLVGPPGGWSA